MSLCDDLKFPFFLTPNPFRYISYFLLHKRFANRIQIKIFLFETFSYQALSSAVQVDNLKSDFREEGRERNKINKLFTS